MKTLCRYSGIAIALLVIAGVASAAGGSGETHPIRAPRGMSSALTAVVHGSGTIQASTSLSLTVPSGSALTAVTARVGEHVSRGQALAQIDPTQAGSAYATALATL